MWCDSINNVTERLWQSGHLQRVSRLLRGGKARIAVAVGLSKAVERRSVPGCTNKLIFSIFQGLFSFCCVSVRPININGNCINRPLQEDLISSFFLWFSFQVAKFYGLARMLKNMEKQCWLLPYWSAYWVNLMSQVWEWIGRSISNQTSGKSIPRQPDQPAV